MFARIVKKMVAVVAGMVLAVVATAEENEGPAPCPARVLSLDKTGTPGERSWSCLPQLLNNMALAEARLWKRRGRDSNPWRGVTPSPV